MSTNETSTSLGKNCRKCGVELTTANTSPSRRKKYDWNCNQCVNLRSSRSIQERRKRKREEAGQLTLDLDSEETSKT